MQAWRGRHMKGLAAGGECRRSGIWLFWGRSSLDEVKNQNKIDAFTKLIIFLAGLNNWIKSFICALNQPIAKRFLGGAAIYYNSHAARPGVWLCHGSVLFWMENAFKHWILSIPTLSIYERVLFCVLQYCVVKYANIFSSCCKESSRPEFGHLRQWQFFHVGINIILWTRRINNRERFFCNIWYHTGWKPVSTLLNVTKGNITFVVYIIRISLFKGDRRFSGESATQGLILASQ